MFSVTLSVTAACTAAPTLSRGMLPYGVRTFLWHAALRQDTSDHSDRPTARVEGRNAMSNLNSRQPFEQFQEGALFGLLDVTDPPSVALLREH